MLKASPAAAVASDRRRPSPDDNVMLTTTITDIAVVSMIAGHFEKNPMTQDETAIDHVSSCTSSSTCMETIDQRDDHFICEDGTAENKRLHNFSDPSPVSLNSATPNIVDCATERKNSQRSTLSPSFHVSAQFRTIPTPRSNDALAITSMTERKNSLHVPLSPSFHLTTQTYISTPPRCNDGSGIANLNSSNDNRNQCFTPRSSGGSSGQSGYLSAPLKIEDAGEELVKGVRHESPLYRSSSSPLANTIKRSTSATTPRSSVSFSYEENNNNSESSNNSNNNNSNNNQEKLNQKSSLRPSLKQSSSIMSTALSNISCNSNTPYSSFSPTNNHALRRKIVTVVSPRSTFPRVHRSDFNCKDNEEAIASSATTLYDIDSCNNTHEKEAREACLAVNELLHNSEDGNNSNTVSKQFKSYEEDSVHQNHDQNDERSVISQHSSILSKSSFRDFSSINEYDNDTIGAAKSYQTGLLSHEKSGDNEQKFTDSSSSHHLHHKNDVKFDGETSSIGTTSDYDESLHSCFTEQKEAIQARMAVNELLYANECQQMGYSMQECDRSVTSAASRRSYYDRYDNPGRMANTLNITSTNNDDESVCTTGRRTRSKSHDPRCSNDDDDESVCTAGSIKKGRSKSHDGRYRNDDDESVHTTGSRRKKKVNNGTSYDGRRTNDDDESVCTAGGRRKTKSKLHDRSYTNDDEKSVCTTDSRRNAKSLDGRYANDDEKSVVTTDSRRNAKSRDGRNANDDEKSECGSRSNAKSSDGKCSADDSSHSNETRSSRRSLQTSFQREFDHFRRKLAHNFQGQKHVEHLDGLHQLLKEDVDALISKNRNDNGLLSKKYYHEKQKNEDAQCKLRLCQEELRDLNHEIRLMDAERDELEERIERIIRKEEKQCLNDDIAKAEIFRLEELLATSEDLVRSLNEKQHEFEDKSRIANELFAENVSLKQQLTKSEDLTRSWNEKRRSLEKTNEEICAENDSLRQMLKTAESKLERESVMMDLLNEINNQRKTNDHVQNIEANEYKEKMLEMETKLEIAKTKINKESKYKEKILEMETKLKIADGMIVTLEKSVDVKERTVKSILEEVRDLKGKSRTTDATLQQEIISLKQKISEYEASRLVHGDVQDSLKNSQLLIINLEKEKTQEQMSYQEKNGKLVGNLSTLQLEISSLKKKIAKCEAVELAHQDVEATQKDSQLLIKNLEKEKMQVQVSFQEKIGELERKLADKCVELSKMKEELDRLELIRSSQEKASNESFLNLQEIVAQTQIEKEELEQLYEETSYELDLIKSDLVKVTEQKDNLEHDLEETSEELDAFVVHHQKCEEHINEQLLSIQNLRKEIVIKNQAYENLSLELEKMRSSIENSDDELRKHIETIMDLEKLTLTKDQMISRIHEESESFKLQRQHELSKLEKAVETGSRTIANLSTELKELKEGLDEKDRTIGNLTSELKTCEKTCKTMEENLLIMRNSMLKKEGEKSLGNDSKEVEKLKSELLATQKRRNELERRVDEMTKLLSKAESIIARTNSITFSSVISKKAQTNDPSVKRTWTKNEVDQWKRLP